MRSFFFFHFSPNLKGYALFFDIYFAVTFLIVFQGIVYLNKSLILLLFVGQDHSIPLILFFFEIIHRPKSENKIQIYLKFSPKNRDNEFVPQRTKKLV